MELFYSAKVTIPFCQIVSLLVVSTLILLFGRVKLALLTMYVFISYWVFLASEGFMAGTVFNTLIYLGFGLLIIIFALIGFFIAME